MASIGHLAVGLAAGHLYHRRTGTHPLRAMVAFSTLACVPDLDALGFRFGVPYAHEWGHRGAAHSLTFAVLLGVFGALLASNAGHRARLV